jgi:hypothetical protein
VTRSTRLAGPREDLSVLKAYVVECTPDRSDLVTHLLGDTEPSTPPSAEFHDPAVEGQTGEGLAVDGAGFPDVRETSRASIGT